MVVKTCGRSEVCGDTMHRYVRYDGYIVSLGVCERQMAATGAMEQSKH